MLKSTSFYSVLFFAIGLAPFMVKAQTQCIYSNLDCLHQSIEREIETIDNPRWKNQAYRDFAVSQAFNDNIDAAIAIIKKIDNSDTQAMTIRAIGMALALHKDLDDDQYHAIFKKLDTVALSIVDEGARDIAYTYIAMAQAFADLDEAAAMTARAMTNPALKHKAFGETAEIQAEKGKYDLAMQSIDEIESTAFKNKALGLVSSIFLKANNLQNAYNTAIRITNPTKKADALQKIVNTQIGLDKQ